jgi:rod shape-determining protein MreD
MTNNPVLLLAFRFLFLVLAQVLVFNRLNFFGFINPMIYILFLYWYPIKENRNLFLILGFFLGFVIDFFSDTMALHAASTLTIAYIRPAIMRFVFGVNFEFQSFKLSNSTRIQQFTFLALLVIAHHVIFFSLEIFSYSNMLLILKKVVFTGLGSIVLCSLFIALFGVSRE